MNTFILTKTELWQFFFVFVFVSNGSASNMALSDADVT